MSKIMIDPPTGWRYGFPLPYDEAVDGPMRDFLLRHGYPEQDVDFALQYIRCWPVEDEPCGT